MRTLTLLLVLLIGCQSRPNGDSPTAGSKTVEADEDFVVTRAAFQRESRARLERINARLRDLGQDASVRLRAARDELAPHVEQITQQGETAFDTFRAELDERFDAIERELGFD
jgi:hypothetical protein